MKTKGNRLFILVMMSVLSLLLVACSQTNSQIKSAAGDIPKEVTDLLTNYLEAGKEGGGLEYVHFENDADKELSYANPVTLLDYKITQSEKVNDDLYAFTILTQDSGMPQQYIDEGDYLQVYNFAARIEGTWYVITNQRNIPDNLKTGFDPSKYSYGDAVIGSMGGIEVMQPELTK